MNKQFVKFSLLEIGYSPLYLAETVSCLQNALYQNDIRRNVIAMLLIEKCKERMTEIGMTRLKLSEITDIPLSTVNAFLSGTVKNPSLLTAGQICSALGVSLDGLLGIESPDMGAEEIERVRKEYESSKDELQKKIDEHNQNILNHEITIKNKEEIIRRQDLRISGLEDRVKFQKRAINIYRVFTVFSVLYGFVVDILSPDVGLIRAEVLEFFKSIFS